MAARVGGPGSRRGLAYATALLVHLALLGAMTLGLHRPETPAPVSVPIPVLDLDLTPFDPARFAAARRRPSRPVWPPPTRADRRRPASEPPAAPPPAAAGSAPQKLEPAIGARPAGPPMGPAADAPTRAALRTSSGCDSADYVALKPAERAACEARDSGLRAKNHQTYAVISQEQKDFFDGACKRDDDWCLYRTGQGPYPGLRALLGKRH